MSSIKLNCLMLAALSFAAASAYSADTGELSANGSFIASSPNGPWNARLSLAFTRTDGVSAFNPGRVTVFNGDGSKVLELNDLGNVKVFQVKSDLPGFHVVLTLSNISTKFTVDSKSYTLSAWAFSNSFNGVATNTGGAALYSEATYENPWGSNLWYMSGPLSSLVIDP